MGNTLLKLSFFGLGVKMQNHSSKFLFACNVSFYFMLKHPRLWVFKVLKEQSDVLCDVNLPDHGRLYLHINGRLHIQRGRQVHLWTTSRFSKRHKKINCLEEFKVYHQLELIPFWTTYFLWQNLLLNLACFQLHTIFWKFWSWNERIPKSHGLRSESMRMSYPYSSKQLFLPQGSTPWSTFNPFQLSSALGETYFLNLVSLHFT